jgi:hypothetical protein
MLAVTHFGRGDVAQSVERRIRIAEAWGSNPHISTNFCWHQLFPLTLFFERSRLSLRRMKDPLHDQKGVVGVILLFLIVVAMFVFVGYRVHLARQNSTKANTVIQP